MIRRSGIVLICLVALQPIVAQSEDEQTRDHAGKGRRGVQAEGDERDARAALATSACGRKGPPVPPSEAEEESR